jgi:hypothetical protein
VLTVGETTTALPESAPGFQVYEIAPAALNVVVEPLQTAVGLAVTVNTGTALTVTVIATEPVQPAVDVPITV